jgi:hypothetical protein
MLDNPADAARMAAAARSRIGEQFRSDLLGQELIETYETALRLAGKRSR